MMHVNGDPVALQIDRAESLASFYTLSPYVVRNGDAFDLLLRLVNRSDDPNQKISRVHAGTSADGQTFAIGDSPVLAPGGMTEDSGGCEDPTFVTGGSGVHVFYSGYSVETRASSMLLAAGGRLDRLAKRGAAFSDERYENPKEAALVSTARGFRMFFEYAAENRSKIGVADAPSIDGPWTFAPTPVEARADRFDPYHLSPISSVRLDDGRVVLFYNGSPEKLAWRIGWVLLDADAETVLARCDEPLITPQHIEEGDTDIAFGASTVVERPGYVWMYYSVSDRILMRSTLHVAGAVSDGALLSASAAERI